MTDFESLGRLAEKCGFDCWAPLDVKKLVFMPEVRDMCASDKCARYGKSWSCPPACGTLEEISARARAYETGILVQTVGQLEDSFDWEGIQDAADRQKKSFLLMWDELKKQLPDVFALGTGTCTICETCTYPDAPCRFPDRCTPSMEACGLLVSDVCKLCGVPYNHGKDTISYTGCFLLE